MSSESAADESSRTNEDQFARRLLIGVQHLVWGRNGEIKRDIFGRWSQGFCFSASEPTALEQIQGGPCAIIAPIQGFILKNLLLKHRDFPSSFQRTEFDLENQSGLLVNALVEVLEQCKTADDPFTVVYLNGLDERNSDALIQDAEQQHDDHQQLEELTVTSNVFHSHLKIHICGTSDDLRKYYQSNVAALMAKYGILLFLYTIIASRGVERICSDSGNTDALIDEVYGYGSQSLINLVMTGKATTYVWNNEQDVGGLKLKGIERQSQIGFITLMEHLRYCTVGSFFKNPVHPVWILASDTHLTVLFSSERRLVSQETKTEHARRVFKNYDPDGNNFIDTKSLSVVLKDLELFSEDAYVDIMAKKLDPESLGIILLGTFMDEFFPVEERSVPDTFSLVHYNGLAQSNLDGRVHYRLGECVLLESFLKGISESNLMLTVLQTKWPSIEIKWNESGAVPSLN